MEVNSKEPRPSLLDDRILVNISLWILRLDHVRISFPYSFQFSLDDVSIHVYPTLAKQELDTVHQGGRHSLPASGSVLVCSRGTSDAVTARLRRDLS